MPAEVPPGYLVDTNVLSNRESAERDPNLIEWFRRHAGLIRVSVITIAEMRRGLVLLERRAAELTDRRVKAREHERFERKKAWYDEVVGRFGDRVEPIDTAVAERWAEVSVRCPSLRDADKAIAATALAKGYGVATRNLGDFRASGVVLVNPYDPSTWGEGYDDPIVSLLKR